MIKVKNTVSFADIFYFADKNYKCAWNDCCDMFHSSELFTYKGYDDFCLDEVKGEIEDIEKGGKYSRPEWLMQYQILRDFMIANNVKDIMVLND